MAAFADGPPGGGPRHERVKMSNNTTEYVHRKGAEVEPGKTIYIPKVGITGHVNSRYNKKGVLLLDALEEGEKYIEGQGKAGGEGGPRAGRILPPPDMEHAQGEGVNCTPGEKLE